MRVDYFRLLVGRSGATDVQIAAKNRAADILFIDIETVGPQTLATVAAGVRRLATEIKSHAATVIRAPSHMDGIDSSTTLSHAELLRNEVIKRLRISETDPPIAVLAHYPFQKASIYGESAIRGYFDADIVSSIRSAEIEALIDHYGALIHSDSVQFVLPNDTTAASFLRFADVLRTKRDCEVVADWLLALVPDSGLSLAIGVDTPGLLPLAFQIELKLKDLGRQVSQTIVTSVYPFGGGDADSLFPHLGPTRGFIYLLSVSRSGRFEDLVTQSLDDLLNEGTVAVLAVLADMRSAADRRPARIERVSLSKIEPPPPLPLGDMAQRSVVRVAAVTFELDPEVGAEAVAPFPLLPGVEDSRFLQILCETSSIGVECAPYTISGSVRPRDRLISFRVLLDSFRGGCVERLMRDSEAAVWAAGVLSADGLETAYDVLVVPDVDAPTGGGLDDARSLMELCGRTIGKTIRLSELALANEDPDRILLFMWGSVTGASAIKSLRAIRQTVSSAGIDCLIAHFRPPSAYEPEYLRRELGLNHLSSLWLTILPWTSAYASEVGRLSRWIVDDVGAAARWTAQVTDRLDVIAPTGSRRDWEVRASPPPSGIGTSARRLLWIASEPAGNSALDDNADWLCDEGSLMFAAAVALERERHPQGYSRPFRVDVSTVVGQDPPPAWVGAIIRQSKVGELWFGIRENEQRECASYLCDWIDSNDRSRTVLAELLAADAVGKLPTAVSRVFRDYASGFAEESWVLEMLLRFVAWSRSD